MLRILLLEDNPDDRVLIVRVLKQEFSALDVKLIKNLESFYKALDADEFDLAITDYQLRWTNGLEVLRAIKARDRDRPVVMFTNTGSQEIAVEAMKSGLDDYVVKSPKHFIRLISAVRSAWERAQTKRKADALELRLQFLLDRLSVGVFRVTLDGSLIESNTAFLTLLGVQSLQEAQDYAIPQLNLKPPQSSHSQKEKHQVQVRRPDCTTIWVEVSETLIAPDNETLIDGLIEDVTERKQAQEALKQLNESLEERVRERTTQIEEVNEELKAFAYSISHDLQEPLRGIQGFAEALLEDYGDRLDSLGQDYLQRIDGAAARLNRMIRDLLEYSAIGSTDFQLQPIELKWVVRETLTRLEVELQRRQAQVRIEQPFPPVWGHYTILVQILINLLSNAIKFVPPERVPQVRLWAEERTTGSPTQPTSVRLWVSDNGIGIAPENQKQIFRVFERLHGLDSYSGNGIGLAIVRQGIERLGGRVGVESQTGQGSQFWIELPLVRNGE